MIRQASSLNLFRDLSWLLKSANSVLAVWLNPGIGFETTGYFRGPVFGRKIYIIIIGKKICRILHKKGYHQWSF